MLQASIQSKTLVLVENYPSFTIWHQLISVASNGIICTAFMSLATQLELNMSLQFAFLIIAGE